MDFLTYFPSTLIVREMFLNPILTNLISCAGNEIYDIIVAY